MEVLERMNVGAALVVFVIPQLEIPTAFNACDSCSSTCTRTANTYEQNHVTQMPISSHGLSSSIIVGNLLTRVFPQSYRIFYHLDWPSQTQGCTIR